MAILPQSLPTLPFLPTKREKYQVQVVVFKETSQNRQKRQAKNTRRYHARARKTQCGVPWSTHNIPYPKLQTTHLTTSFPTYYSAPNTASKTQSAKNSGAPYPSNLRLSRLFVLKTATYGMIFLPISCLFRQDFCLFPFIYMNKTHHSCAVDHVFDIVFSSPLDVVTLRRNMSLFKLRNRIACKAPHHSAPHTHPSHLSRRFRPHHTPASAVE